MPAQPAAAAAPGAQAQAHGGGSELVRRVRVGRQALYDARRKVAAYQVLFRTSADGGSNGGSSGGPGGVPDDHAGSEQATSQVIATTFATFGLDALADGRPVFANVTRAFLTGVLPMPVEPAGVVLDVVDRLVVDPELLQGLSRLRSAGYRIAVDNYGGDVGRSALIEVADYVKIHFTSLPPMVAPGLVQACRSTGATLVATDIDDAATFTRCADLGFELFQGRHLNRPTELEQRTLSPSQVLCMRLLNLLVDPQLSVGIIERMVGSDPGLTLRLLRTANAAAAGTGTQVASLRQALVLIGPRRLRSWLVLTLLEGGTTHNPAQDLWSVLARGYTCRRLAPSDPDVAFTVGLLSGAADLLGGTLDQVADGSGIGPAARSALVDGAGAAGHALRAVLAHERDDAHAVTASGLSPLEVSQAYLESLRESLQLVREVTGRS